MPSRGGCPCLLPQHGHDVEVLQAEARCRQHRLHGDVRAAKAAHATVSVRSTLEEIDHAGVGADTAHRQQ